MDVAEVSDRLVRRPASGRRRVSGPAVLRAGCVRSRRAVLRELFDDVPSQDLLADDLGHATGLLGFQAGVLASHLPEPELAETSWMGALVAACGLLHDIAYL